MENICARCHEMGRGCCVQRESNNDHQIGIFQKDIENICNHLGVTQDYFIDIGKVTDEFRESLSSLIHPIFDKIYHNNTKYCLKTIDKACIFLTNDGCKLPAEIRPLYCRIYPFWLSKNEEYIIVLSSYECLAQRKSTLSYKIVNENFGYSEEYIRNIFNKMLEYSERQQIKQ